VGTIEIPPGEHPSRVLADTGVEVFLDWERARDDGGDLRRCICCGSEALYRHRRFPRMTGFVIVLAIALGLGGMLGLATGLPFSIAMVVVLLLDVGVLVLARDALVCYRCGSSYRRLRIAAYHERWSRAKARISADS
jgi:uncharacterized membrane protein (Fun14 family)